MSDDIIRAGSLWGYEQLVRCEGGDPGALLQEAGLSADALEDFDDYLPRSAVIDLLELTASRLPCPDFGLRLAEAQDLNVLGALAFAIRNSCDLGSAIRTASKYLSYHAPAPTLDIEEAVLPSNQRIVYRIGLDAPRPSRQTVEYAVGLISRLIRLLTRGMAQQKRVLLTHAPVGALPVYEEHFGLMPEFEEEVDAVVVVRTDLNLPLKEANEQLKLLVERFLETHSPNPSHLADQQVRHVLARLLRAGPTSIADVADALHAHPRTLQRRLKARGSTFEQLRDDVRKELAAIYLAHERVPLAHVAHILGYADQSVLTRSCLRWFGKTPLGVRHELVARAQADRAGDARASASPVGARR